MTQNRNRFGESLGKAIRLIHIHEDKPLGVIRDELAFLINHADGEYIRYLEKGNIPPDRNEVEKLIKELVKRKGLEQSHCHDLLTAAGHPQARQLSSRWFDGVIPNTNGNHENAVEANENGNANEKVFVAGPPIHIPHLFFGRTREIQRIFSYWRATPFEHVAIIGKRRSGKSSLLHYLRTITTTSVSNLRANQKHDYLPRPQRIRWIFLDLQAAGMEQEEAVLRALLSGFGLSELTPCTREQVFDAIAHSNDPRQTILLLDELEAGVANLPRNFWWALRSLVTNSPNRNLALGVASCINPSELGHDSSGVSPFSNIFNIESIGVFTESEAKELIEASPIAFSETDKLWILEQSRRWPLLLQILCQERLLALENEDKTTQWQQDGLNRIQKFSQLWDE